MIYVDDLILNEVTNGFHIPTKPEILTDFQKFMLDTETNLAGETAIIGQDPTLSAAILKAVNSPYFGFTRKFNNIRQAACFLGLDGINYLATALLLKKSLASKSFCFSFERFWYDATDFANAMMFIGTNRCCVVPIESLYTVGLLRDCGIVALALRYPDYRLLLGERVEFAFNSLAKENKSFGMNHAIIGYFIAASWHLPKAICNIILQHHELDFLVNVTNSAEQRIYATLKVAENIRERKLKFRQSPDWQFIGKDVLNVLNMSKGEYLDLENGYCAVNAKCNAIAVKQSH